ncbi:MAG TPA: thioredoxin domain-containing protein, partial [Nannocystaceae bacterium]|nr:thioredoxin domain-containing protein [Nannocystaceae bacterium]
PIGIGLLGVDPPTVAVSIGTSDPAKLREALPTVLASVTGAAAPTITDRGFGDVQGWWLEAPKPTAVLVRGKRLVAIFGVEQAEASVVSHHAEKLAKLERGQTLADRPGFERLVREPGDPVWFAYVDGISARTAVPIGQAAFVGVRMAFAEIDAAAMVLSRDGPRLHLGTQTVLREGSQARQYVADVERSGKLPGRVPGPALAAADVAFASEPAIQAVVSFASLAGVWNEVEGEFRKATQLDLRTDVLDNLSGELGWALHRLPSKVGADDFATLVYIGVKDSDKAKSAIGKLVGQAHAQFGVPEATVETLGGTEVHVIAAPVKVQVFVAHGAVWCTFGGTDAREIVDGPAKNLQAAARIDPIGESLAPGGTLAGYFDIREFALALDPLLDDEEKQRKAELEPVIAPLEALTARSETKDRTAMFRLTLHTSSDDALAGLVRGTMKVAGAQFARELQRAQRLERCETLATHLVELAKTDTSRSIPEFELRYDVRDKCIEKGSLPAIDCAIAATSFAAVASCATGDEAFLPEEPDPQAVPYIDDIWPNTKSEPSGTGRPRADVNYGVDIGPDPQSRGNADALVTIIEFGDFQCPHCQRVAATVDQVLSRHGPEVRVVFRHLPLAMHPEAKNAAKAALAAARQGKFWEMHDKLFERQFELAPDKYRTYASEVGLDLAKFDTDFADAALDGRIEDDVAAATRFGATGTPSFFVNGRFISGVQPIEVFDALVKEEMERARRFVERRGHTRKKLYDDMTSRFASEVQKATVTPVPPDTGERFEIATAGLPKKGASAFARISVVECADFDCPYCQRATKTITRLLADYPTQLSFFFLHNPLSFHPSAEAAARAAVAADKQGKFWEMHDKLYDQQDARTEADFIRFATELKLDADKFKTDFAAAETATTVAEQKKICTDNRATGTPSFFVNGRLVEGAQPYETFRAILDAELAGGI